MDSMDEEQENVNSTVNRDPMLGEWGMGDIRSINARKICVS